MANDRLYIRCTKCGDYECLGKYYPSMAGHISRPEALAEFAEKHIESCQIEGLTKADYGDANQPICVIFDSEATFCAAGGMIPGTGNVNRDRTGNKDCRTDQPGAVAPAKLPR